MHRLMAQEPVPVTLATAAKVLDPAIHLKSLRRLVEAAGLAPIGRERSGGRPAATYDWAALCRLHADWVNADRERRAATR